MAARHQQSLAVAGGPVELDDHAFGWPARRLSALPGGDYFVQAVLNRYEAFHLADGRNLMLPPDKGEGQRDWPTLGTKLAGKIHIYVGNEDNYYLTDSVYFAQERLEALRPEYRGEVAHGDRAEHCWNGDPTLPNAYSRLHYNYQYLPRSWNASRQRHLRGRT